MRPATPFVTILTDIADYPPHFWIEPQEQYLICGSDRAVAQARALGIPGGRIFQASGMIVHPRFYQPCPATGARSGSSAGLIPICPPGWCCLAGKVPTPCSKSPSAWMPKVLTIYNSFSSAGATKAGRRPAPSPHPPAKLRRRLYPQVPFYMTLSDFFIGKPGPGSVSEAVAMRLPVIVERNAWTLPQERYNAEWILEKGLGLVVRGPDQIPAAAKQLLSRGNLARYRGQAAAIHNQAVYEIPGILRRIVEGASGDPQPQPEKSLSEQRTVSFR